MTRQQALRLVLAVLGAVLLVFAYFLFKSFAAQPGKLVIYLAVGVAAAIVIAFVVKPRAKFSRCPDCGRSVITKDTVIFPGGTASDGEQLLAIVERRYLCQSCNFRTYQVHEIEPGKIDEADLKRAKHKNTDITQEEYQALLKKTQEEVEAKNAEPKNTGSQWTY